MSNVHSIFQSDIDRLQFIATRAVGGWYATSFVERDEAMIVVGFGTSNSPPQRRRQNTCRCELPCGEYESTRDKIDAAMGKEHDQ